MRTTRFRNRRDAGRMLGELLRPLAEASEVVVLGLPRGGIPVAFEVASALDAPLDVLVVRKLGVPGQEEVAMGAIASGGVEVIDDQMVRMLHITPAQIERTLAEERVELARRERAFRGTRPPVEVEGRTVILVDDGLATGASMLAATTALKQRHPRAIIVAAPVGSRSACAAMARVTDRCVCAITPEPFFGVGNWYADFDQTSDDEVRELLAGANARTARAPRPNAGFTG